jgi:HEAT repeat protein
MRLMSLMARIKAALAGHREPASPANPPKAPTGTRNSAEIEALIAALRQQPPGTRRGANVSLTDLGVDDAFVPSLVVATRDADSYLRASAVHALAEYDLTRHPRAEAAVLHRLAHDAEAAIRAAAVATLGTQVEAAVHAYVPACIRALDDPSAEVRREAVQVLGRWPSEPVAAALRARLQQDTDAEVRAQAVSGLAICDAVNAVPDLFAAVTDPEGSVRAAALEALCACLGTEDATLRDLLLAALSDPAPEVRRQAAEALRFGPPQALPALLAAANDPEPQVRLAVVIAMGSLQDAQAVDTLAARVFDEVDEEVRYYAVSALGELHDARATQHLISAFQTLSLGQRVRWGALWALGERADSAALQLLCTALRDPDAEFRARAAESLANLPWDTPTDAERVLPQLLAAVRDPVAEVRRYACEALASMGDPLALPALAEALQDDDEAVRCAAITALGRIDGAGRVESILAALADPSWSVRLAAAEALRLPAGSAMPPAALAALHSFAAQPHLQVVLAQALARHGDPAFVPHLLDALTSAHPDARAGQVEALRAQPDARALAPMLGLLDDVDESVRGEAALVLGALGDDTAIAPLAARLGAEPEPYVRARLVWALSFLAPQPVVPLLARSLADDDEGVREHAAQALTEICPLPALQDLLSGLPPRNTSARNALQMAITAREEEAATGTWRDTRLIGRGTVQYS